jgi:mRNA interferase MazF
VRPGEVLLTALRQADGTLKDRPVLFLKRMPPFQDFLVCGISTQIQHRVPELDEVITPSDPDFHASGLKAASVIRLGYLAVLPRLDFRGRIGSISSSRLKRLLTRLSDFLRPEND